jgi:hypothetical protein
MILKNKLYNHFFNSFNKSNEENKPSDDEPRGIEDLLFKST